ncbi:Leucine-rich repeat-containing protein 52 [Tupaia chinensis]|uniref:Leucine-rich repeat-containing protein 52 n=1 Tax=Tupaia chinensis TaxID=246437 RepID=L9L7R0_TUPCH|nr:Leucine-rich repeat-containing protein 52 [Tupaia chinensis]
MPRAAGPGPGWLLFSFGMGLVSGSKCPKGCECQAQEVVCKGQQLSEYPPDIPLNTRRLILSENRITSLPAMQLGLLSDLVYLDCHKNRIQEVMDYTFVGVFRLIYLDLSSNNLSSISPFSFSVLGHLVRLSLANNPHLSSLSKYTFANASSLRYLDLRNTGLKTLDRAAFQHLTVLQTVFLSENPWQCNCSFLDFAIYLIVSHLEPSGRPQWSGLASCRPGSLSSSRAPSRHFTPPTPKLQDAWQRTRGRDPAVTGTESHVLLQHNQYGAGTSLVLTHEQNATCTEPPELLDWPITRVGNPLRYMCITHLDSHDYIFLLFIGFCIFAAGTVAAWLMGVCAVLYQNASRKSSDDEAEDEGLKGVALDLTTLPHPHHAPHLSFAAVGKSLGPQLGAGLQAAVLQAGTVPAWLMGVCAVLYQNASRKSSDDEAEDEGLKVGVDRRIFQSRDRVNHDGFPQMI